MQMKSFLSFLTKVNLNRAPPKVLFSIRDVSVWLGHHENKVNWLDQSGMAAASGSYTSGPRLSEY